MRRAALVLVALALVIGGVVLVRSRPAGESFDRGNPLAVFRRTMEAVHDGDWKMLRTLLTKEARAELERDLTRLKRRLAHPEDGRHERTLAARRLGEASEAEIRRVVAGGLEEALRFYVLIAPRERSPSPRGMQAQQLEYRVLYESADGTLRPVRIVRVHDEWLVADLQL